MIESLPEDNPYIKYFTPQKENLASLAKLYIATLGRILGDLFVKEEWSNTNEPILSATSSSHFYTKSTVFVCRTENTMDKVSLFQRRFIMAELKKDDDYFLNKVENSDTQYSLSISHSSLFKINSSCIAYYKTAAKDIYTPPDEIQWQGAMINNNIPTLWLELENNENYTHVLKQLKQHILTETHSNLEGDEIILIRKNKDTGNLVLRILDAREITKIHISRFAPGKCLTP